MKTMRVLRGLIVGSLLYCLGSPIISTANHAASNQPPLPAGFHSLNKQPTSDYFSSGFPSFNLGEIVAPALPFGAMPGNRSLLEPSRLRIEDFTVTVKWFVADACGDGSGCSYYFNVCNNAKTNYQGDSPGVCKEVNVANEKIQGIRGTRELQLEKGGDYRIVIVADNAPSIGKGRWAAVKRVLNLQYDKGVVIGPPDFEYWKPCC